MAVKQKTVENVGAAKEARLQLILRALQDISGQDGFCEFCAQIVKSLGTVPVPTDPSTYMKFVEEIKKVQYILTKECSERQQIFIALKALYDEISKPSKNLSLAMAVVLQLIDESYIPSAVQYILNAGYSEEKIERALHTLCSWLQKCVWAKNLAPLVLYFMKGLEAEQHYDILIDVTSANIEPLFKLIMFPEIRKSVGPVVLYMLSRSQHNSQVFHKIVPFVPTVCKQLDKERSDSSVQYLQDVVDLCVALMEHFPGHPELYDPLHKVLQPYYSDANYKRSLHCKSWGDGASSFIPSRSSEGKVGLNNLGNTCYMNSVLQSLFMTKIFRNEVLLYNKQMLPLFSKLQILFALLQYSKKFSLSPNDILQSSRPPGFLPGHQHDSSEFLGFLLDTLHEQEQNSTGQNLCSSGEGAASVTPIQTVVQQSFGGRSLTVSRCGECTTKSERVDNFRDLQLSIPTPAENHSVQTLLDYYLQPEKLSDDNQYRCDVCNRLTDGERITRMVEAPPRLILTLKHFRYDQSSQQRTKLLQVVKLDKFIRLDLHEYELYAAVVHCGSSVDSGHYYTFAKDIGDWYKFNDCSVMKTSFEDLCKLKPPETPYILFYSRADMSEPENLPRGILSVNLQSALTADQLEYESEKKVQSIKMYKLNHNDEQPPPGCGGGGFTSPAGNMFVC